MRFNPQFVRISSFLILLGLSLGVWAQAGTGSLHGTVTDPSGATVANATVAAITPDGQGRTATTNRSGGYEINGLPPGTYTVTVNAPGFADFAQDNVEVGADRSQLLNVALAIAVEKENVNVTDEAGAGV